MLQALISLLPYRNAFRVGLVLLRFPAMRMTYTAVLWNITILTCCFINHFSPESTEVIVTWLLLTTDKTRTAFLTLMGAGHHLWTPWLARTCHKPAYCVLCMNSSNSAHFMVVLAVHGKKYLLLVLYSLKNCQKRPGYSAVVSLSGKTQQI